MHEAKKMRWKFGIVVLAKNSKFLTILYAYPAKRFYADTVLRNNTM